MPEQLIHVKHQASDMYPDFEKRQDSCVYGSSSNISNSNSDICRICHCETDVGNPLMSPCYCAGSLKYVHQTCLQQWLAASDTRSCELCKFNFILHTKIKPISEWRRLEMSSIERRRLLCSIVFHFLAAVCVVWSMFVLIDRAAEEVQKGLIAWPFWTKLVVVAVGVTGGAVFMYIQCRQYLHVFSRWKAHNRIILVQNAPEKQPLPPPSPTFTMTLSPDPLPPLPLGGGAMIASRGGGGGGASQMLASVDVCPQYAHGGGGGGGSKQQPVSESCYVFMKSAKSAVEDDLDASGRERDRDRDRERDPLSCYRNVSHPPAKSPSLPPALLLAHSSLDDGLDSLTGGGGKSASSRSPSNTPHSTPLPPYAPLTQLCRSQTSTEREPLTSGIANSSSNHARRNTTAGAATASCDAALELNIQEVLALEVEYSARQKLSKTARAATRDESARISDDLEAAKERIKQQRSVFKSMPNLSPNSSSGTEN